MFSSQQAIEFWNNKAESFLRISRAQNSFYNQRLNKIEKLICSFTSPSLALDVGSAEGDLVFRLCQLGYTAYGTDISEYMIKAAIKKAEDILPAAACRFRLMQGTTPPYINKFNLITVIGVLPYVNYHHSFLQYISSMLEKNGIIIITCTNPFSFFNLKQIIKHLSKFTFNEIWVRQLINMFRTGILSGGFVEHSNKHQVHTIRALTKLLKVSGYQICETVSFYNVACLDNNPTSRNLIGLMLSRLFGWTHLAVAQKTTIHSIGK